MQYTKILCFLKRVVFIFVLVTYGIFLNKCVLYYFLRNSHADSKEKLACFMAICKIKPTIGRTLLEF